MIVWIPMRPEDSETAARAAVRLCDGPRVDHFYDAERAAGRAIARSLGGDGEVAWDVYLAYPSSTAWERTPPPPSAWAHQLRGSAWADPARYHAGAGLAPELRRMVMELLRAP